MASRFGSFSLPLWAGPAAAVVATLVVGVVAVTTLTGGDDAGTRTLAGPGVDTTIEIPTIEPRAGEPGDADEPAGDGIAGGAGGDEALDDDAAARWRGDDAAAADGEADVPAVDTTISENPLVIALMVADADALTPQEVSLTAMLEGNGHRVRPFTVTEEPIVNARNNPRVDVLLFSPSFEFSLLYYPSDPNSLPMLDMARYSWYRRYMLPWGDDVVGPRFSGTGDTSVNVYYEDADVIAWEGQEEGFVQVLTGERFSGEAPLKEAMDHSTNGAAQYFLRQGSDSDAEATIGVYVPAGSTITLPAPTVGEERAVHVGGAVDRPARGDRRPRRRQPVPRDDPGRRGLVRSSPATPRDLLRDSRTSGTPIRAARGRPGQPEWGRKGSSLVSHLLRAEELVGSGTSEGEKRALTPAVEEADEPPRSRANKM